MSNQNSEAQNTPEAESPESLGLNSAEQLLSQIKDKENKYLYLYAEFENYKKRAIKERSELIKFGWEAVARDLLQVADNLERAFKFAPPSTDAPWLEGLHMVLSDFRSTLKKQGVELIESVQKPFDPNLHEAVGQIPSDAPAGTIVQEEQQGYLLHGRLLRPSRVLISSGKPPENQN